MNQDYKNWKLTFTHPQILWLHFDKENSQTNSITLDVLAELERILNNVEKNSDLLGVIICSAKANGFIAGADISSITQLKTAEQAGEFITRGQTVFNQLAKMKIPTLAAINGFCLGGGLELALACRYRIADDQTNTKLGLPEVKLGIHPGWGGTLRLPKLLGAITGLDLILSGRTVNATTAEKMGLIDAAVPTRHFKTAAEYFILNTPPLHEASFFKNLAHCSWIRPFIARYCRYQLAQKISPEHYPAPYALLELWEKYGTDAAILLPAEAASLTKYVHSKTAQNLIRVFLLQERLKQFAKKSLFIPQHVHVIGAGTMGGDIAAWCALQGLRVTLQDQNSQIITTAFQRAYLLAKQKLKQPRLIQAMMDRLVPDIEGCGIKTADVIIEAIYENLAVKQDLFKQIEAQAEPHALLATNTSSILIDDIANVLKQPGRLIGIHFFNPVAKMRLVEIVQGTRSESIAVERAIVFTRKIDRLPLPVKSSPGFLINRILTPYLLEAIRMMEEGYSIHCIDKAAVAFGMPMGPIKLADTIGLDVCLSVAENLQETLNITIPEFLREAVQKGYKGTKVGKGLYQLFEKSTNDNNGEDISRRLINCLVQEAQACLAAGIAADADLIDAGMIFGTGFAPFRGGPLHYAKQQQS